MSQTKVIKLILIWIVLMSAITENAAWWGRRRRRRRRAPPPPPPPPDTTRPTFRYCPGDLGNKYTIGTSRQVSWGQPTATDNKGSPIVTIVSGKHSGSTFNVRSARYTTQYRAVDGAGNFATCEVTFKVVGIRCSTLAAPFHGRVSCTNSNFISSICTFACSTGYYVSGGTMRTCSRSGNRGYWTGTQPSCRRITCGSLTHPANGGLSCTDGCYYGSSCTFSCDYGYTIQTSQPTWSCLLSGDWSGDGSIPLCADTMAPTFTRCPDAQTINAPPLATYTSVIWATPEASDNSEDPVTLVREQGPASGSYFGNGRHVVAYKAMDSSGNSAMCSFSITVNVFYCSVQTGDQILKVNCSHGNILGSNCTFSCSTGHSLQGRQVLRCLIDISTGLSRWNSAAPYCEVLQCEELFPLDMLDNGYLVGDCGKNYGDTCHFECNPGYEINNNKLICSALPDSPLAFWSGESPNCSRIHCVKPQLTNALQISITPDCPNGTLVPSGNSCNISCSRGYYLQGSDSLTCQMNGTWSNNTPACNLITCGVADLPIPINAAIDQSCTTERVDYGTVCILSCEDGYEATGSGKMSCSDNNGSPFGVWIGNIQCSLVTCPVPVPQSIGTTVNCSYSGESSVVSLRQNVSASCMFGCEDGYTMVKGSAVRQCLPSGQWDGVPIICEDITAPELSCHNDVELIADPTKTSTVIPWNLWEPILATDLGKTVAATLYSINSIVVTGNRPSSFSEGSYIIGYRAVDSAGNYVHCSFSVNVTVHRCSPLSIASRSILKMVSGVGSCDGGAVYGSVCSVSCEAGYTLSTGGSSLNLSCDLVESNENFTATWSNGYPICNIVQCDVPAVMNGLSACQSLSVPYQTTCQFDCQPGYMTPSGDEQSIRTCQADKQWSGYDFQCTAIKTCQTGFSITYGKVTPSECSSVNPVPFGFNCSFSCDNGFQLNGPTTLGCNTDGQWNFDSVPTCRDVEAPTFDVTCPLTVNVDAQFGNTTAQINYYEPIPSDNSGIVNITRLNTAHAPGSVFPEGKTTIQYQAIDAEGLASFCDVIVTVKVYRCTIQQPPDHGSVSGCNDPYLGSECLFACDVGYDLNGTSTLRCELATHDTVTWNGATPHCLVQTCLPLQVPELASLSGCQNLTVPYKSTCTFSCPIGFIGIGGSQKTCLENGVWSSTNFSCERVPCEVLSEPDFITISPEECLSSPRFGDVCSLMCNQSGFQITPPILRDVTCTSNKTWTNDIRSAQCVDSQPPQFEHCPSDIILFANTSSNSAFVDWYVLVQDNDQSHEPVVTCDHHPGNLSIGEYFVQCNALDEAGNRAWCYFTIKVKARRCQPYNPPAHGNVVGGCDTSYGSICDIGCSVGYELTGSPSVTCEFDGSQMFWYSNDALLCIEIQCTTLGIPDFINVSPIACNDSTSMIVPGTICILSCPFALTIDGDSQPLTCLATGEWNRKLNTSSLLCIDQVPPFVTSCPPTIMRNRTEYWGVEETFFYPSAEDNFDMELEVTVDPPDLKSPYNFTSDTTCTYTFTDDAGNSASCVFHVDISNQVLPVITTCPSDREVKTNKAKGIVEWHEPSYMDMPGITFSTTCNAPNSPIELPWGTHNITCRVFDVDSGIALECVMRFMIRPVLCPALNTPAHGALACDTFAFGRYCSVLCEDGYDVPLIGSGRGGVTAGLYNCGNSGKWYPQEQVPDCSETRSSRRSLQATMYYPSPCTFNDTTSIDAIATQFLTIIEQSNFQSICTGNNQCSVENVNVSCGQKSRRRRSLGHNMDLESRRHTFNTKVTMFLRAPRTNTPTDNTDIGGAQDDHILNNMAKHIHRHILKHLSKDNNLETSKEEADILEEEATLILGDVSVSCDKGYYLDKDASCVSCPAGYYLDDSSSHCNPCDLGFYQDETAQLDCKPCGKGMSTERVGATHVGQCEELCKPGHFSSTGLAPCLQCDIGFYQPHEGQTICKKCPSGLITPAYGATTRADCREPCPAGSYSVNGFLPCEQCPRGFYQPHVQRTSCNRCKHNTTTTEAGATSIERCIIVRKKARGEN